MALLKQKTVSVGNQSQTIVLKRPKNSMNSGGEWMYVIEDKDTGGRIEDPFTNKREAKRAFRQSVKDIERGMQSAKADKDPGGLGSSGTGFGRDQLLDPGGDGGLL